MKAFRRLVVSEFKQFVRERSALFWTFAFPVFFILVFGAIFSGEDNVTFDVGLVVQDDSTPAQGLSVALKQMPAFKLHIGERDAELQALKEGDRRAVIVIPPDFGVTLSRGDRGSVDVYYDPAQTSSAQVVLPIIRRVVDEFDRVLGQAPSLIELNEETLQAQNLRSIDYLVPGILAMALMQLGSSPPCL